MVGFLIVKKSTKYKESEVYINMNIILNEDNSLRTTKFNSDKIYELSDINIYIPNDVTYTNIYIVLINKLGINDIIPLELSERTATHKKYRFTYTNPIRINSGEVEVKILLIDVNNNYSAIVSGDLVCSVNIDNYRIAYQTIISEQVSSNVAKAYDKIKELTEMNIEIYEKILKESETK